MNKKNTTTTNNKSILIVGGGVSGMTVAVEAAETGYDVVIVEKNPYLGGRVLQMNKYFPKLCPPSCGFEINLRRIKQNTKIRHYTLAEVEKITGQIGDYNVTVKLNPRYVNERCTACNACSETCPVERPDDFNLDLGKTKAAYLPHEMSFPLRYIIDKTFCKEKECNKCVEVCKYDAIDMDMEIKTIELNAGSIVFATGWHPYDATKIDNLGFGQYQNVVNNVILERLAAPNGPTEGKITRPSDKKEPKSIAFVQCAGSRDENHLPYCSSICCMATLKQATYFQEQYPNSKIYIFYIDIRAEGTYEDFYIQIQNNKNVVFIKGKVAKITEDPNTKDVIVKAEDIFSGLKKSVKVDMAVLATGMEPNGMESILPFEMSYDEFGFAGGERGIFFTGVAKNPVDVSTSVQDATGTALKAIQSVVSI